jgi:hypothetical protein
MSIINFLLLILFNKINYLDEENSFEDSPYASKPFKPHYQKYILPYVKKFEKKRLESLKNLRTFCIVYFPILIIIFVPLNYFNITYTSNFNTKNLLLGISGVIFLFFFYIIFSIIPLYKESVKEIIFPKIFSFFGRHYCYNSKGGHMSVRSLEASGIIPYFDFEEKEDYIKGRYKGVGIRFFETKLVRESINVFGFNSLQEKQPTDPKTVFKGIFILLDMNKTFSGNTIITKDGGIIKNWLNDKFNGLENVQLEDRIFEKHFQVYSSDQVEARYILTTSFMERLIELANLLKGSSIQCSFYKKNRILLMIPCNLNRFEVSSIFYPATFKDDIQTILSQMDLIFQIIDVLELNNKTGL